MTLSPAFLDELRARTHLSSLIARSLKLTKAGREYKACCPFHSEKTPSFYVNDEKGFYHCFGCQAHGDAIRWLTDAKGLAFMDAVKELADAAGMEVPVPDPRAQARSERAAGLYEVTAAAQAWFVEQLNGIEGAAARDYLKARGIDAATLERFGFGFAPDSRGKLKTALARFGNDKLIEAGLIIQPDEGEREPYDRFRGRLTFPIRDPRGRVIAFSARILGPGEPKYLNSPDTPLFDKGRALFNYDLAAPASRAANRVIVVEGQMDAIALAQAGIGEAVAPLGTAVTEAQLGLLWRLSPAPIFCLDGDAAGQKAAVRAALRALPGVGPGRSLTFVTLPAGQDPDDLVRSRGREALEALLESPEPLVDRLWRHERDAESLATPEQRAGLRRRLLDHVSAITDPDTRDQYRAALLDRFAALAGPPRQGFTPRRPFAPQRPLSPEAKSLGRTGIDGELGRAVLAGLCRFPDLIADHVEAIDRLPLPDRDAARLRDILVESALSHPMLDCDALNAILAARSAAALNEPARLKRALAFSFTRRNAEPERARRDLVLAIEALAARPGLEAALAAATARAKLGDDQRALDEQRDLIFARQEADRKLATLFEGGAD
ncbi:DNA primase [Sphingosinicella sp.]|uniref:DNA primase n=1 Tax=Sphingosinicella sp. TaxID=1917971 RepID=UPI0040381036